MIADDSHAKFAFLFGAEEMVFACGMVVGYETGIGAELAAIQAHNQVCSCARGGVVRDGRRSESPEPCRNDAR